MGAVIWQQSRFFLVALGVGLWLRCIYDIVLLWRRIWKHSFFWIGVEDALYWFWNCIFVFSFFYRENNGIIRGFVLAGIFGGMLIYHIGPSYYVVEGCFRIYQIIERLVKAIWVVSVSPFRWIMKKIVRITKKIYKNLLQKYKNCFTLKTCTKKVSKKIRGKERKGFKHGDKDQADKKNSSKWKRDGEKKREKATIFSTSVSSHCISSNADSLNFRQRKASRK